MASRTLLPLLATFVLLLGLQHQAEALRHLPQNFQAEALRHLPQQVQGTSHGEKMGETASKKSFAHGVTPLNLEATGETKINAATQPSQTISKSDVDTTKKDDVECEGHKKKHNPNIRDHAYIRGEENSYHTLDRKDSKIEDNDGRYMNHARNAYGMTFPQGKGHKFSSRP